MYCKGHGMQLPLCQCNKTQDYHVLIELHMELKSTMQLIFAS